MTPRPKRQIFGIVFVTIWAGLLMLAVATTGPDRRSPFAEHPLTHLVWAVLITTLGAYVLVYPGHCVRAYTAGINWGPFRMSDAAIFRLVVLTGILLTVAGMALGVVAVTHLV
jgi:hypothetical protein